MAADLLAYGLPLVLAIISGTLAGGLTAWKLTRRKAVVESTAAAVEAAAEDSELVGAEIDLMSVAFAEKHDLPPQAAGLLAERLKLLDRLGRRKGWLQ